MSVAAPQALDRGAVPWLFATALIATAPHFFHQPEWLTGLALLIFGWGGWLWWRGLRLPGRWWLVALVVASCAGIVLQFRSLFGREAGLALLVVFTAMKLLELRSRRDAAVVTVLGYFLLLTHYFHSQSILTGAWLFAASLIVTATLIRLHGGPNSRLLPTLRYAALLTVQAVPFMLVLYLLFPRIGGPLWGLPQDAYNGRTGLSGSMSPGSIANLAQNGDIAFRARFESTPPSRGRLYWRGPVLEEFDGQTWKAMDALALARPDISGQDPPLRYAVTLEPHNQRWLLALDAPSTWPADSRLLANLTLLGNRPITQRQRIELTTTLDYRFNVQESGTTLQRALRLPAGRNPRAQALGQSWRETIVDPGSRVEQALTLFRTGNFVYTLTPPLLAGDTMDEFLFGTRRGFCEHYAAAFVVLMRAAGVPARVITGYQGGELNPLDGYLVVRQSDAHAWAEVWLAGQGWVRVDPTAAIAPTRIESGLAEAMPGSDALPALVALRQDWLRSLRFRWEALNNGWNQWILGYNPERQRELMGRLGLPDADWQTLAKWLFGACGLVLLLVSAWTLAHRPRLDPAQRLWRRASARLGRRGIDCPEWMPPLAVLARVEAGQPALAPAFRSFVEHYLACRYGPGPTNLKALRRALAALP